MGGSETSVGENETAGNTYGVKHNRGRDVRENEKTAMGLEKSNSITKDRRRGIVLRARETGRKKCQQG